MSYLKTILSMLLITLLGTSFNITKSNNVNLEYRESLKHKETDFGSTSAHKARTRRILSEKSR